MEQKIGTMHTDMRASQTGLAHLARNGTCRRWDADATSDRDGLPALRTLEREVLDLRSKVLM